VRAGVAVVLAAFVVAQGPGVIHKAYRPLSANLYYFVGRSLFGNNIEVYHAVDALTHLANAGAMGAAVGACASGHHRVSG
jgi:hypothetical protein